MKARRKSAKRRRTSGALISDAEFERRMERTLAAVRRGLFGGDTFEEAVASLRRQLVMRGGDGTLHDVVCHLNENGRSAMLSAEWGSDQPVHAEFTLPAPVAEEKFDPWGYVAKAEAAKR